ncbi:MAG: Rieske (2Fe-2S) protein [Haloferacaceae archaeon]
MSDRVEVAAVEELPPGEREIVTVEGRSIGVFNVDGEYYALENACCHEGGPVCEGKLQSALVGEYTEPGQRVAESFSGPPAIACPWHGWEYDVTTGEHLGDSDVRLPTFEVVVEDGVVTLVL